jgi:MFS family permease
MTARASGWTARTGLYFVLLFGAVNLFADFAYEGARSVGGPFLAGLGATGLIAGLVGGFGEFIGYALRLLTGRWADRSGRYWAITIFGYVVQMIAVPALALAGSWQAAAGLMVMERLGKAIRNPARNVMLAEAGETIGRGWAFGVNEALDQIGAFLGPIVIAAFFAARQDYSAAFAWLAVPAAIVLLLVLTARFAYPKASEITRAVGAHQADGFSRAFWWYAGASALVAFGFADYSLIAFHFAKGGVMPAVAVPVVYAFGMLAGGAGALFFGKLYDHAGLKVLVPVTIAGAFFAPLVFLGGYSFAVFGVLLWGLAEGVHESVMSAAVADMVPAEKRGSAYGVFTTIFGVAWFAGSAVEGALYDHSIVALVAVAMGAQLLAVAPLLMAVKKTQATL